MLLTSKTLARAMLLSAAALALRVAAADGTSTAPDISGPWQFTGSTTLKAVDGKAPPLTPMMQATYSKNAAAFKAGDRANDPAGKCLPPGIPRILMQPYPFNIVQGKVMYGFMFTWNHLNRIVYMNQDHFDSIGPLYLGQSVGHWDGDTLVIDTNQFNDTTLLDDSGLPHTDALHTVERLRLADGGKRLEDRIRFEDAGAFTQPWEAVLKFEHRPTAVITEDYCLGRTGHGSLEQK